MPEFCKYLNCHNLASSTYDGYCNENHKKRGPETEFLFRIVETHKDISTLKEARAHKATSSSHCFANWNSLQKRAKEDVTTSSFHCEVCKALLRE
jgi:hypothetical protein